MIEENQMSSNFIIAQSTNVVRSVSISFVVV